MLPLPDQQLLSLWGRHTSQWHRQCGKKQHGQRAFGMEHVTHDLAAPTGFAQAGQHQSDSADTAVMGAPRLWMDGSVALWWATICFAER